MAVLDSAEMQNRAPVSGFITFLYLLICFCQLFTFQSIAQESEFVISGTVVDGISHEPVPLAGFTIRGSGDTMTANRDGQFTLKLIESPSLRIIFFADGYYTTEEEILLPLSEESVLIHLAPRISYSSEVIVIGKRHGNEIIKALDAYGELSGRKLNRESSLTLAETMKNLPGVSTRTFGPAAARPVIRGMGGERVAVIQDGVKTVDLSATSPDHAVSVESATIERISLVRGPAILQRSGTVAGGLLEVNREDIPEKMPRHIFSITGLSFETINSAKTASLIAKIPFHSFAFHTEYSIRKAAELSTPRGKIKNSDLQTENFSVGGSYIFEKGFFGMNLRELNSSYGVPGGFIGAHLNGVDVSIFKRENNFKANYKFNALPIEQVSIHANRNYFRQVEYETKDIVGAEFTLNNLSFSTDLEINKSLSLGDDKVGISYEITDFRSGGFVFTPPVKTYETAFYYWGSASGILNFEWGFRYSGKSFSPSHVNPSTNPVYLVRRDFNSFSASIAISYLTVKNVSFGFSLSHSSRIPSIEELYNQGPHLAAYTYETGNPQSTLEGAYNGEFIVNYSSENNSIQASLYYNNFYNYISQRNTGKINFARLLPIYTISGEPAELYGMEINSRVQLASALLINSSISLIEGRYKNNGGFLPMIPPQKARIEAIYSFENISLSGSMDAVSSQKKVDQYESPTAGYLLFGGALEGTFETIDFLSSATFSVENIFNSEYRNHLSKLRVIHPEAGRNLRLSYKVYL